MTFHYRPALAFDANMGVIVVYRPRVPVRVYGPNGMARYIAIVDTGSDRSLFPDSVANDVGISLDYVAFERVTSYGGKTLHAKIVNATIELTGGIDAIRWDAQIGFVTFDDPDDEVLILGHVGCLDFFTATFDGKSKWLELNPNDSLPAVPIP
jgi:hypothetical protein